MSRLPREGRVGLALLGGLLLLALFGPPLCAAAGLDAYALDAAGLLSPPSWSHPLGTDDFGRDALARLLLGARLSLLIAGATALGALLIGGSVGLVAGYAGGRTDRLLSRLIDLAMAPPRIPLMMLLLAVDLEKLTGTAALGGAGGAVLKLVVVVVAFQWTTLARIARLEGLRLRAAGFVSAARALGLSERRILLAHVLPNAAPALAVATAIEVSEVVVYESVLSFLGLGVPPPHPSWGAMLSHGLSYAGSAPWLLVMPGLASFVAASAALLLGDGLRIGLEPARARFSIARRANLGQDPRASPSP